MSVYTRRRSAATPGRDQLSLLPETCQLTVPWQAMGRLNGPDEVMKLQNPTINVGSIRIDALYDMPFNIDRERIFPAIGDDDWTDLADFLTEDGKVQLEIVCYLIRSEGRTILCDSGLGRAPGTGEEGNLLADLESCGVGRQNIDTLIFTHAHGDHVGWNVDWSGEEPKAVFPNAKYVIQRSEWDHTLTLQNAKTGRLWYVS